VGRAEEVPAVRAAVAVGVAVADLVVAGVAAGVGRGCPAHAATSPSTTAVSPPTAVRLALLIAVLTGRILAAGRPQPSRVFSSRRITLPVEVFGRSGTNRTERGSL
jgi:hypothetical protein